jgi:hypothetical protein
MNPDPAAGLGQRCRDMLRGQRFSLTVAKLVCKAQARKRRVRRGDRAVGLVPDRQTWLRLVRSLKRYAAADDANSKPGLRAPGVKSAIILKF